MEVALKWITPDAEALIVEIARVSNPESAAAGLGGEKLIQYLIKNKHWSPFEMAHACLSIKASRDITRQVLRHGKGFDFQEFSQRYAEVQSFETRETRLQHPTNRQSSIPNEDPELAAWWEGRQCEVIALATGSYKAALDRRIAKEVARAILPEGLTQTHMYMVGPLRSWIHYTQVRIGNGTQKEHEDVANAAHGILMQHAPTIFTIVQKFEQV